jgi:hypothetical protein
MKWDATVSQFEECGMNLLPGRHERDTFDEALSEISTDNIEQEPDELRKPLHTAFPYHR